MDQLSSYILTKNSEKYLNEILSTISPVVDEIIIVDSGSNDHTEEIAKKYPNAKFIYRQFDNFKNQRNFAADSCSFDYIFFLDSDEIPTQELIDNLSYLKKTGFSSHAYKVERKWLVLNKEIHALYPVTSPDYPIRLINKNIVRFEDSSNRVHETPSGFDSFEILNGSITHKTFETKQELNNKLQHYTDIAALDLIDSGKPVNFIKEILSPIGAFIKWYLLKGGIKDGATGLILGRYAYLYSQKKYQKARKIRNSKLQ